MYCTKSSIYHCIRIGGDETISISHVKSISRIAMLWLQITISPGNFITTHHANCIYITIYHHFNISRSLLQSCSGRNMWCLILLDRNVLIRRHEWAENHLFHGNQMFYVYPSCNDVIYHLQLIYWNIYTFCFSIFCFESQPYTDVLLADMLTLAYYTYTTYKVLHVVFIWTWNRLKWHMCWLISQMCK